MPPKKAKAAAAVASDEPDVPAPLDSGRVESGATPWPKRASKSQTNTLAAQKSTLMGPPQSAMTARNFNESPVVAPATWPGVPMSQDWCEAIGMLFSHRTEVNHSSRVITFELVQCLTASLGIHKFDGDLLSATQDDTVSVPQATWMRYALGAYLAALDGDPANAPPKIKMFTSSALAKHVKTQWNTVRLTAGITNIPEEQARRRQNFPPPPPLAPSKLDNDALTQLQLNPTCKG